MNTFVAFVLVGCTENKYLERFSIFLIIVNKRTRLKKIENFSLFNLNDTNKTTTRYQIKFQKSKFKSCLIFR